MRIRSDAPDNDSLATRALRTVRFAVIVAIGFTLLNFALTANHPSWNTLAGWAHIFGASLVFAFCITVTIDLLFAAARRLLGARVPTFVLWQRLLFWWGIPLIGLAIAMPIAAALTGVGDAAPGSGPEIHTTPLGAATFMLLIISIFFGYFWLRERQRRAERQATEAQLRLLQGQMEPHFLFNTLANVISLMEVDTPRAKRMLESFTDYLRASLGSLRHDDHTLGDELDLVDAYLRVVEVRMDDRLRYAVDVPRELRSLQLPALSLQPLVENAIVHGLEPKIEGGEVRIAAQLDASGALVVSVTDNGLGLQAPGKSKTRGSGTALANIRERLLQTPGAAGSLRIEPAQPQGVIATLTLARPNRKAVCPTP